MVSYAEEERDKDVLFGKQSQINMRLRMSNHTATGVDN